MVIGRFIWMKKGASSHLAHKHHIVYRVLAAIPCRPREPLTAVAASGAPGQRAPKGYACERSECSPFRVATHTALLLLVDVVPCSGIPLVRKSGPYPKALG